ncbi:MAG: C39 family peptidase [Gammaproteobacteria bacterium]|nr:C39 family peptidase [Gammaproteobacteria bacterium]
MTSGHVSDSLNRIKLMYAMASVFWALSGAAHTQPTSVGIHLNGDLSVQSWKATRNKKIIMQELDFSCGSAALATLLTYYYGLNVTEKDVLTAIGKNSWLSMADMKSSLPQWGLKGIGLALDYEQLTQLKIPVIIYFHTWAGPHFAVLRGIDKHTVWVADPASGNNKYPVEKFREKWEVRGTKTHKGKILLVLPSDNKNLSVRQDYFVNLESGHQN